MFFVEVTWLHRATCGAQERNVLQTGKAVRFPRKTEGPGMSAAPESAPAAGS